MSDLTNDNDRARGPSLREADAHGQAAMLLVESLIHGLIERSVITVADAVEIVEVATEVKAAIGADMGDSPATLAASVALLGSIGDSLKHDLT
ncbi:hypothetical protein [Sphingomonas sp. LM7]|uniref:hypothetical protein n=1 Tax=Sphingomonas sp. LM7 TaxID=1938607 RepID=UPI0012373C48|nr:hypothetical protein [Sphingomonas sp. LM7]